MFEADSPDPSSTIEDQRRAESVPVGETDKPHRRCPHPIAGPHPFLALSLPLKYPAVEDTRWMAH